MDRPGSSIKYLFALGLALTLTACNGSPQETLAKAQNNEARGQYRSAMILLKNMLQDHPDNGRGWLLLGRASLHLGNPVDAESELRNAEKHGVSKAELALPLARTLLIMGKPDDLLKEIQPDLASDVDARAQLLSLRGEAYLATNKAPEAEKSFNAALQASPRLTEAFVGLAKVALSREDRAGAEKQLKAAWDVRPNDPRAWMLQGQMEFSQEKFSEAESDFQRALEPEDPSILPQMRFMAQAKMAEAQIRQKNYQEALKNIEALNKIAPDQPYANYLRALVAYHLKDYKTAVTHLQQTLRVEPNNLPAQLLSGAVDYALGRYGQADMHLSSVIGADSSNTNARKLLALTLYKEGQPDQAVDILRPIAGDKYTDDQLLAMVTRIGSKPPMVDQLRAGQPDAQTGAPPQTTGDQALQFARQYLVAGQAQQAIDLLEKTPPSGDGSYGRERLIIVAYLREGSQEKALAEAHELVHAHPDEAQPHLLLGDTLIATGDHKEAKEEFEQALELAPDNEAVLMSLGLLATEMHKYEDANRQFHKILAQQPESATAMMGLAHVADLQGHDDEALEWVEKARAADTNAVTPRLALARYYTQHGKPKQALAAAKEAARVAPQSPAAQNALGIAQLDTGDKAAAVDSFAKAVSLSPRSPLFHVNLARARMASGDFDKARTELKTVVDKHPNFVPGAALYSLAELQAGHLDQAVAVAKGLRKGKADDKQQVISYALEGDLYLLSRKFDDASAAYEQALEHGGASRTLLVKNLTAAGAARKAGADERAVKYLADHSDDGAVRSALGDYYMSLNRNDDAIKQYTAVVKAHPDSAKTLNNLAWLYTLKHDPKAIEYADKAHKLAPKVAAVADTLGWALLQNGQTDRAVKVLREAAKQAPASSEIRYHFASALAQSGDKPQARELLAKLLEVKDGFSDRGAAEKLYDSLKE